jgi:GalNAc-alpha-(1->4)-GalNAc-alpha-(1->3)-diNAcBac-PP-undecaprenol alpha-1,4-N-acetyl-D-galactosaminyltransferase
MHATCNGAVLNTSSAIERTVSASAKCVAIVISDLRLGGAERSAVHLAKILKRAGRSVRIFTFAAVRSPSELEVDFGVSVERLGLLNESDSTLAGIRANRKRIATLRRVLVDLAPDLVVSFVHATNVLTIRALRDTPIPVIVCEESEPSVAPTSRRWRMLRWWTYPAATRVIVHTSAAAAWFGRRLRSTLRVVPNAVVLPPAEAAVEGRTRERVSLSVGRLGREKGYDLLIKAFAIAGHSRPGWQLQILGEGRERQNLEQCAQALGLEGRFSLPGLQAQPWPYYRRASVFVSSSRHEGFGIALCEAMASGCAVIATSCPGGPQEIIEHGVSGLLVRSEDVDRLAAAMGTLMDDKDLRSSLAAGARERAAQYTPERVDPQWLQVIDEALPSEAP